MRYRNERAILSQIYSNMTVELEGRDTPVDKALEAIVKVTKDFDKVPNPKRILTILVRDYNDIIIKDNVLCFIIDSDDESNNKGGEIVKNYETRYTSGEKKVAVDVIKTFEEAFKIRSPSRMVFEDCLKKTFPKIGKNSHQATEKLINGGYLQEKEGKILLGKKGKEILSQ